MRKKIYSMLALLCLTVSSAWADNYLYLVVDGTSATVKYGADKGTKPYYREDPNDPDSYGWYVAMDEYMPDQVTDYNGKKTLTTVTIDASCQNYTGTTLESFFDFWSGLTTINNLENLNTSEVTNMKRMFAGCSSLTSLDPSSWNTAKVTNMYYMFNSVSVETLDLSGWNTSSVTNMYCMFYNCSKLETIYVGDGWSTASVTNGDLMFGKCTSLPGFDSGNVTHAMAKLTTDGGYLTYKAPEPEPSTYTVTLKEGTEDATSWTIAPAEATTTGVAAGTTVTATYSGTKKVKSVKAVKKASAPAEEPVTLATPLTLEATSDGTIVVNNPMEGMKYSLNGAAKTTDGIAEINVSAGDKVAFYGDGTNITAYFVNVRTYTGIAGGTATVKVYGNIMSLVDEEGFATATELTEKCAFYYLFDSNTTLTDASGLLLPATTLTIDCYNSMFRNCTSLTTSPAELPATTLANRCYASMFHGCTSLATAPELPATTLNERCYYSMFRNCESLTTAPELKAETLTPDCYASMFQGCTSLATAPELKATTLAESCYDYMFQGCTSLTAVPELKATTLKVECYRYMFQGCTSLTAVPADLLPATELAQECYYSMFNGCTGLTTVPADFLPATTLAEGCYYYMFNGCTGLTTVPTDLLKAEELAKQCYCKMFMGCTGLTAAPNLPATTLPESCYQGMFQGCTGLTAAPAFGTMTTVGKNSCKNMFQGCTGLTAAPALGATTLDEGCYYSMFQGCEALTTVPAKLPAQTLAKDCYNSMFMGCTSLTTAPAIDATTLANTCCSSMFQDCASLTAAPELPATTLATSCYQKMFMGCISLTAAPALPATELANTCYLSMFQGCTSLTTAPELPATTLKVQCYRNMFQGCTSLPAAPELPAQTLVSNCYNGMFQNCPSLASVTCLATNISASGCLTNWLINAGTMATEPKLYVDASMTEAAWNNGIFTVTVNAPAGPTYPVALNAVTTSDYVGSVITSDGYVYAKASDATAASKTAVAIIAYVGTAGSVDSSSDSYKGLAIAMSNCGNDYMQWTEKGNGNYVNQAGNITTAIGYKNGIACTNMLSNDGHTAAIAAASNNNTAAPAGTSGWFLPSMGQWNLILQGLATKKTGSAVTTDLLRNTENNTINANNLNSVITAAGGTAFKSNDYWSSTQYDDDWEAWSVKLGKGCAREYAFTNYCYVRSVLAF